MKEQNGKSNNLIKIEINKEEITNLTSAKSSINIHSNAPKYIQIKNDKNKNININNNKSPRKKEKDNIKIEIIKRNYSLDKNKEEKEKNNENNNKKKIRKIKKKWIGKRKIYERTRPKASIRNLKNKDDLEGEVKSAKIDRLIDE